MSEVTVNDKGAIGVAEVIADLLRQRLYIFLPFDGSSPVDLIVADKAMSLRRLQVKYRTLENGSFLRVPLSSVVNGKRRPIDRSKIDGWAVFCPDTDKIYYVPLSRVSPASNHLNIQTGELLSEWHDPKIFWSVG